MPFCSTCGNSVHDRDIFCSSCGVRQPVASGAPPFAPPDAFQSLSPRTAAILCYVPVVGWIAAVAVLAAQRFRGNAKLRFHAFQGLYLFAAWLLVDWGVRPILQAVGDHVFRADRVLEALIFGASIFMIVKASQEEVYSLPVIGDLAHRSAMEG